MLTTVKTMTRREKRNSASKSRKNYKKYKKKPGEKTVTLLRKKNHYHSIKDTEKPRKFENFR
jgi:rRNA pseudouridine-1189 N-methylase Emg1 (Nep1/Mra1 family)